MHDLYKVLGVTKNASLEDIKKAYRVLSLNAHPDRGGNVEIMKAINDAYEILSDPEKRNNYDFKCGGLQELEFDEQIASNDVSLIEAGELKKYSQKFKEQHSLLIKKYKGAPLEKISASTYFNKFESNIYKIDIENDEVRYFHDIFSLIQYTSKNSIPINQLPSPKGRLTPEKVIKLFTEFLAGYHIEKLAEVEKYLEAEIYRIGTTGQYQSELKLYNAVCDIILFPKGMYKDKRILMKAMQDITEFAKEAPDSILVELIPLFYNKFFRNMYAYGLHVYWNSKVSVFDKEKLEIFDGRLELKSIIKKLIDNLPESNFVNQDDLISKIKQLKLFYLFDKDVHSEKKDKQEYRNKAFHLLDWIPAIVGISNKKTIVNIFLQIGIKFQQASLVETRQDIIMADENLALKMYLTAVAFGQHNSTPDVEMYANTEALKYIAFLNYPDPVLKEAVLALQKRTLLLADIFPFIDASQPNIVFHQQENKPLHLMRKFLNNLMGIVEQSNSSPESTIVDYSRSTILYQVYEACLKNWYQEQHDPVFERKLRLELMEELLFEKNWDFMDVALNTDSPWIMVNRDDSGWMVPSRIPYEKRDNDTKVYRLINGAEINNKTGKITFSVEPWYEGRPDYEKLFTLYDLQEMLAKNLSAAIFSLDPVDSDKEYHPFNNMRIAPPQLCDSELLNTMLLTDYMLKFLTTRHEVQGQYPYDIRPIEQMIQHMPEYLRQIITSFWQHGQSGATHRFWIEAEEMDMSLYNESSKYGESVEKIKLGNLKMIVKKHRMERDINGDLKDTGNEDEGWPMYVLTLEQIEKLKQGIRKISGQAMIFISGHAELFYWKNNKIICSYEPEDYRETLTRLYKQPRDNDEKIIQSSKNMALIYRVTKKMASKTNQSHNYSPEFIFAHEFTIHYDEFAQYLPEFGRLKELSKITALIKILNGHRLSNKEHLKIIDFFITAKDLNVPDRNSLNLELYNLYYNDYKNNIDNIKFFISNKISSLDLSHFIKSWNERLNEIKNQIGSLELSSFSPEVNDAVEHIIKENLARDSSASRLSLLYNMPRQQIAKQLSDAKKEAYRKQLSELFSPKLSSLSRNDIIKLINDFLNEKISPLAAKLAENERKEAVIAAEKNLKEQFPKNSNQDIKSALSGNESAIDKIARFAMLDKYNEMKEDKEKSEESFVKIGLGSDAEPVDLKERCMWVPASVHHEVECFSSGSRGMHFVYGGVSIGPKLNISHNGNNYRSFSCSTSVTVDDGARRAGGASASGGNHFGGSSSSGNEPPYSSSFPKDTQRLLGKADRMKAQFFERPGKAKHETSLNAAKIELNGGQIPLAAERGRTYDHITKVQRAQDGLLDHIESIKKKLGSKNLPIKEKDALEQELSKSSKLLDYTEEFVPRTTRETAKL